MKSAGLVWASGGLGWALHIDIACGGNAPFLAAGRKFLGVTSVALDDLG